MFKISKLAGFKASTNDQLKPIRELDLFTRRTKLEADATIPDAEKRARIAEINQQLAALK